MYSKFSIPEPMTLYSISLFSYLHTKKTKNQLRTCNIMLPQKYFNSKKNKQKHFFFNKFNTNRIEKQKNNKTDDKKCTPN